MRLWLDGTEVTPHADWPATELVIQRDQERYTIAVQLQNVTLHSDAFTKLKNDEINKYVWNVKVDLGGVQLQGKLLKHEIVWYSDRAVVSVDIDNAQVFARDIAGRLVPAQVIESFPIVIRPKVDRATVVMLLISTFIITYLAAKEAFDLGRDIAVVLGIMGAGVTGPVSGTATKIALIALRALYLAALIAALVQLIREISNLLARIDETSGFRLLRALNAICSQAGYTLQAPGWLENVWVVGESVGTLEATELFNIAKQLTYSALLISNNTVKFVPMSGTFPIGLRKAHEEGYRYTSDTVPRRELISLLRDPADSYSLRAPAALEIDRPGLMGFQRHDIPLAPGVAAGEPPYGELIQKLLQALATFSRRVRNINAQLEAAKDYLIAEREGFANKLVYTINKTKIPPQNILFEKIYAHYSQKRVNKRFENVRIPFHASELPSLLQAGFPGVHEMRWKVYEDWAEITYDTDALQVTQQTYRII